MQNNHKHQKTIAHIINKINMITTSLRYASKCLPTKQMISLYYCQVYPHLIYAISIWGATGVHEYLKPLIRTQKKMLRIIANRPPRSHTKPLMDEFKILNLVDLYKQRVCLEMHPYIHPPDEEASRPEHQHRYTKVSEVHNYGTRYSKQNHFFIPARQRPNNQPAACAASPLTSKFMEVWHGLPQDLRDTKSFPIFKKHLQRHLLRAHSLRTHSYPPPHQT